MVNQEYRDRGPVHLRTVGTGPFKIPWFEDRALRRARKSVDKMLDALDKIKKSGQGSQ